MPEQGQLIVDWASAEAVLRAEIERRRAGRDTVIVGITGPVGAGKSTLAQRLSPVVISTDSYLPDYDRLPREQWDDPAHADLNLLARNLEDLRAGRAAVVPVWSFQSHSREGFREVAPTTVVVCEGLHALHAAVGAVLDLAVFVDAPQVVRWARCEQRELTGQRGWGVEAAREFFHAVAEPTYLQRIDEYRAAADVLVLNGG